MSIEVLPFIGAEAHQFKSDLARLRAQVFREFPYLYEANLEYESKYLDWFLSCPESFIAICRVNGSVVGASTCLPLSDESEDMKRAVSNAGYDVDKTMYYGESVLEPAYRGRGIGNRFFEEREKYTQSLKRFRHACFCAVVRAETHPLRPQGYRPLDRLWHKHGFYKKDGVVCTFEWPELDQTENKTHTMQFWFKAFK